MGSIVLLMVLLQIHLLMGFCLFKGNFGKIGQPHPYTRARLIFLVRLANLGQVVRWGSHMEPRRVDKN